MSTHQGLLCKIDFFLRNFEMQVADVAQNSIEKVLFIDAPLPSPPLKGEVRQGS